MNAPVDSGPPPEDARRSFPPDLKVLVVEDESIIALDVEQMLHDHGVRHVYLAASLKQARRLLATSPGIGLAVVDIKLEDGSGMELIAEFTGKGIPVIMATGYDVQDAGSIQVLSKPYSAQVLIRAAFKALEV